MTTAYEPQHSVRAGELAARIYERWVVAATKDIIDPEYFEIKPGDVEEIAGFACDAAAIFMAELRRRDALTCERIHQHLPPDTDDDIYEE